MQECAFGSVFRDRVKECGPRCALKVKRVGLGNEITWEEWGRHVSHSAIGLTPTLKVDRRVVQEKSKELVNRMYVE